MKYVRATWFTNKKKRWPLVFKTGNRVRSQLEKDYLEAIAKGEIELSFGEGSFTVEVRGNEALMDEFKKNLKSSKESFCALACDVRVGEDSVEKCSTQTN